jgi:hypothetical protein
MTVFVACRAMVESECRSETPMHHWSGGHLAAHRRIRSSAT